MIESTSEAGFAYQPQVREARWAPVAAGEYDRRTRTISVNLTVVDAVQARHRHDRGLIIAAVVAHETVHHLHAARDRRPHDEERQAREAAVSAAGPDVVAHIDAVLAEAWA